MTKTETLKLLAVIKTAYPEFMRDSDEEAAVELWHLMFEKYSYGDCNHAVTKHIQTCKFAPKISEILETVKLRAKWGEPTLEGMQRMIKIHLSMFEPGDEIPEKLLQDCEKYGVDVPPRLLEAATAALLAPDEPEPTRDKTPLSSEEIQMLCMEARSYG